MDNKFGLSTKLNSLTSIQNVEQCTIVVVKYIVTSPGTLLCQVPKLIIHLS